MNINRKRSFIFLTAWFALLGSVYWGFGNTRFTMPITYVYFALCLLLSVSYVLINGGIRPVRAKEGDEKPLRVNIFRLSEEKQNRYSRVLLILDIPFLLIFLIDFLFLKFFAKG